MEEKILVGFHVGRGGSFNNGGHLSFLPNVHCIQDCIGDDDLIINTDDIGQELPEEKWYMCSSTSGECYPDMVGKEAIEAKEGIIERDGIYDTDVVMDLSVCWDKHLEAIWECYNRNTEAIDEKIKDYIVGWKGLKRIHHVDYLENCALFFSTPKDVAYTLSYDNGYKEEDIREVLEEEGFDEISIDNHITTFMSHCEL